jgi:hypothetical protein
VQRNHRCERGCPERPWTSPVSGSRASAALAASGTSRSTSTRQPDGSPHFAPTFILSSSKSSAGVDALLPAVVAGVLLARDERNEAPSLVQ